MIDLWTSRRDKFLECEYWSQDMAEENGVDIDEIAYKLSSTGSFYAKESNQYTTENQVLGELFMAEEKNITLFTEDDISDLKVNDIVKFDENIYRVENIQRAPYKKQRQFLRNSYSNSYYISLRG